jgi:predicted esterase
VSSEEDETPVTPDDDYKRAEKVVKTYKFEDEFYAPLYDKLIFKDTKTDKTLPYSIHIPDNYSKSKKYPVLLLLHGRGAQGSDHTSASTSFATLFTFNADVVNDAIIVIPQTTGWWSVHETGNEDGWLGAVMRLLYKIEDTYSCDKDRVYVMGLSMGGYGTWDILSHYSDHFAAGVPICGGGDPAFADILADIPIWIYHGESDDTVNIHQSEVMYNAITKAGGKKIHFTRLSGVKHDSWLNAFESRELISWMFSQNKSKNKDSSYELIPYFRILDSNGKTVITEFDAAALAFANMSGVEQFEFILTPNGLKKLTTAYKNSGGKKFTAYYGTQKLVTFTCTTEPTDSSYILENIFTENNYWRYLNRIELVLKKD